MKTFPQTFGQIEVLDEDFLQQIKFFILRRIRDQYTIDENHRRL